MVFFHFIYQIVSEWFISNCGKMMFHSFNEKNTLFEAACIFCTVFDVVFRFSREFGIAMSGNHVVWIDSMSFLNLIFLSYRFNNQTRYTKSDFLKNENVVVGLPMFKDISSIFHIIIKLHSAELNFHNDAWQYLWMHNKDIPFANFSSLNHSLSHAHFICFGCITTWIR